MLKISEEQLASLERDYPGIIADQIRRFENAQLPPCPQCGSTDTASVQVGIIGRTMRIAGATTNFRLIANGPKPGSCYCNSCEAYFG